MILAALNRIINVFSISIYRFYTLFGDGTWIPVSNLAVEFEVFHKKSNLTLAWEFNKSKYQTMGLYVTIPFLLNFYVGIGSPYWRKITAHVKNKNYAQYGLIASVDLVKLMWAYGFDGGKVFKFSIYESLFGSFTTYRKIFIDEKTFDRIVYAPNGQTSYLRFHVEECLAVKEVKRFFTDRSERYEYRVRVEHVRGDNLNLPAGYLERIFLLDEGNKYECVIEQTLNGINLYLYK